MSRTIGLDGRMWFHPGIGRYIRELVAAMERSSARESLRVWVPDGCAEKLRERFKSVEFVDSGVPIYSITEQWRLPRLAGSVDLFHSPHFNIPIFSNKPLVVTIHDLTYLEHPETASRFGASQYARFMLSRAVDKARAIIAVSESTRSSIVRFFPGTDPSRITVIHEAASPAFGLVRPEDSITASALKFGLSKPFVLFVGTFKPHKNIPALVEAHRRLRQSGKWEGDLVLAGRIPPSSRAETERWQKVPGVRVLSDVTDPELAVLYAGCECFVMPSFLEGFGLPVIEAMACGAPVLAASTGSLPEVVGSEGILFDPHNIDELESVLYNVLSDQDLRLKMKKASLARSTCFSWQKTAERTWEVYRKAIA